MSISELTPMPERARRIEVFTGAGRRRNWPADEKAAIVAESYAPGRTVCGVARRHGLTPAQLFTWRRLARRSRGPKAPALFVPAVVEPSPVCRFLPRHSRGAPAGTGPSWGSSRPDAEALFRSRPRFQLKTIERQRSAPSQRTNPLSREGAARRAALGMSGVR